MGALSQFEGNILLWIQNNLRNDFTDPIVKFITHLGDHGYLWIALLLILLCIPKTRKAALIGAATLLMTYIITNLCLKPLVARARPYEVIEGLTRIIEKQGDRSFPSGHTANSMAVGVSLWMVSRKYEEFEMAIKSVKSAKAGQAAGNVKMEKPGNVDKPGRKLYFPKAAGWFVLVLSILIGLSRLYVGVHFPTDVLGGAVIAIVDSIVVGAVAKKIMIRA